MRKRIGILWIALCKCLVAILEFSLKDWLHSQAYPPQDRYTRYGIDVNVQSAADEMGTSIDQSYIAGDPSIDSDRYSRLS